MDNQIEISLRADKETESIEFKESLDVSSSHDWCEIIKDIIAIANTDGGVIVIGLNDLGVPVGTDVSSVLGLDPADITNKIYKYTGFQFSQFKIQKCEKEGYILVALQIGSVSLPIAFEKPGTYDIGAGKQKNAFSAGTVYFRHGAKSEPGNTHDIQKAFERTLEIVRESWLKNVRQVVEAPFGASILTIPADSNVSVLDAINSQPVRIVNDPDALMVNIREEDLSKIAPYDYRSLTDALRERYSNFIANSDYHRIRHPLENDLRYCRTRYLDPKNQNGIKKRFYSAMIFEEFDKHYTKK
jgi:hypothetical protein